MPALKLLTPVAATLAMLACAPSAENRAEEPVETSVDRNLLGGAGEVTEISEPDSAPDDGAGLGRADGAEGACERVGAAEARGFANLEPAGTSGAYRFYGEPRKLLCSEPGPEGRGECELVGLTVVRVEGPDETYGFRTASDAILTYAPDGFGCWAR